MFGTVAFSCNSLASLHQIPAIKLEHTQFNILGCLEVVEVTAILVSSLMLPKIYE